MSSHQADRLQVHYDSSHCQTVSEGVLSTSSCPHTSQIPTLLCHTSQPKGPATDVLVWSSAEEPRCAGNSVHHKRVSTNCTTHKSSSRQQQ